MWVRKLSDTQNTLKAIIAKVEKCWNLTFFFITNT